MLKNICLKRFAVVVLTTLMAASVSAQLSSPIKLYAGGGLSEHHKPPAFKTFFNTGWHLTAGVGYNVMPMVELVGNFEYHSFSNNLVIGNLGDVNGGAIKTAMFGLLIKVAPSLPMIPIKPYGLTGIGMAKVTQSDFDWPAGIQVGTIDSFERQLHLENQTKFYYSLGGGLTYSLIPKVSLFAEARYSTIQIDGGETVFDNPLRFWAITGGVRLL